MIRVLFLEGKKNYNAEEVALNRTRAGKNMIFGECAAALGVGEAKEHHFDKRRESHLDGCIRIIQQQQLDG